MSSSVEPCPYGQLEGRPLTAFGLIQIDVAASSLGIEPKRLRGYIFRNGLGDPIGDMGHVYGWSCATLIKRLAGIKGAIT